MRVHTLRRALAQQNLPTLLSYAPGLDVLIVQKRLTEQHLRIAQEARANGCLIVYDVDDLGDALWWWTTPALLERAVALADLVITATPEQRDHMVREFEARHVAVLPCPIDYYPMSPASPVLRNATPLRVLWFGNYSNFPLVEPYLAPLTELPDVQPVLVTTAERIESLSRRYPTLECTAWSVGSFVDVLRSTDLVLLMHDGAADDRAKSNNKMVTSVAWGVPAVVSCTPEYERTSRELQVEEALFEGVGGFASAIERLRPVAARAAYLARAQPRVWGKYAPAVIARQLLNLLDSVARHRGDR